MKWVDFVTHGVVYRLSMNKLSLILNTLALTFSITGFALTDQKVKVYDGTNFDEVVCRFYLDFPVKYPFSSLDDASLTQYRSNENLNRYDFSGQIYRSFDSKLYFSIEHGFLKNQTLNFNKENIPNAFSKFAKQENGFIKIINRNDEVKLQWFFPRLNVDNLFAYFVFVSINAIGPLCKEVLSNENRELTLDLLTTRFYEAANPKYVPGIKVSE